VTTEAALTSDFLHYDFTQVTHKRTHTPEKTNHIVAVSPWVERVVEGVHHTLQKVAPVCGNNLGATGQEWGSRVVFVYLANLLNRFRYLLYPLFLLVYISINDQLRYL
jgi:dienelactone hydrolase